jgi:hypothetical protein
LAGNALALLTVFYAGAVVASLCAWLSVWRGRIGYSALRDVTGIGDRAALRRCFGLTGPDGAYRVTFADVFRRRRPAGVILSDLPVHALFLAALIWAALSAETPAATGILCAASAHALLVAGAALSVLAASRRATAG